MKPPEVHRHRRVALWSGLGRVSLVAVVLGSISTSSAEAQQASGSVEVKAVVGLVGFLDERTDYRFVIGGAVRTYVSDQVAVEPEFLYIRHSESREEFVLQANVVRDVAGNDTLRPYLVGSIGIRHVRETFLGARRPFFSYNTVTGGGGAGIRIQASDRLFVTPEFRMGWQPLLRATVAIGGRVRR